MTNDIWIVTAYFNPCRYFTKKYNFDIFSERLRKIGVHLLVVEMALEDGAFEIATDHRVIRVRGNGLMWQKERLLNIGIANLPSSCTKVAWVDCDLLFDDDAWLHKTSDALEHFAVVQPFGSCLRLPRGHLEFQGEVQAGEQITESFAAVFARDRTLARHGIYKEHGHTGYAWAARRELLDACGLYDACLTGSGDHLMAHVFAGALDSRCIPAMIGSGHPYAEHFDRWAARVDRIVQGSLSHVPGRVLHLWHGEMADRRYFWRNQVFKNFAFDPDRHLRRDANGLWDWAEAPADIRAWSNDLFFSRNEDGERAVWAAPSE
jgi:hypothetical protein